MIMINHNCKIKKITNPFPYVVIDNFFSDQFYIELEKYFPKSEEFQINNVGRMHGDTTYGDILYNQLINKSEAYSKLHEWVYSEKFINYFTDFFSNEIENQTDLIEDPKKFEKISKPIEIGKVFNMTLI